MKTRHFKLILFAFAALLPLSGSSEDTDIYIDNSRPPSAKPQVMFSLDYRANLTSTLCMNASSASCTQAAFFRRGDLNDLSADISALGSDRFYFIDLLRLSLKAALQRPEFIDQLKVGFMLSHNQDNCAAGFSTTPNCSNGGMIMRGFEEILAEDSNNALRDFSNVLSRLRQLKATPNSADHPYQGAELFFEFYRYLRGIGVVTGHNAVHDYEQVGGRTSANADVEYPMASWDKSIENLAGNTYLSPLAGNDCSKLFTVNFFFGNSQDGTDNVSLMNTPIASGGLNKTAANTIGGQNQAFGDIVNYLHANDLGTQAYLGSNLKGDQRVTSYFYFDGSLQNVVDDLAFKGGTGMGRLIGSDPGKLIEDLVALFREILSTSTTFVAASVPVNVFNRAEAVDNVFIAIFSADRDGRPFWNGNVKKLKIGGTTDNPKLIDSDEPAGGEAIAPDGRVSANALTYWSRNSPASLLPADSANAIPENELGRDGRRVPLGGAGQNIPGFIPDGSGLTSPGLLNTDGRRQLYYLDPGSDSTRALNADAATATALRTALKAADDAESLALLKYVRGFNAAGTGVRPWLMGDPLHSRPRPINYGLCCGHSVTGNPAIYIAVGGNDGYMRLIENTTGGGAESGREVWAFMPPEAMASTRPAPKDYAVQKILRANVALTDPRHPASVDGAPAELIIDIDGDGNVEAAAGDRVLLYFGLRRGGSAYYALDITTPAATPPANKPNLQWRITNASAGFEDMGLSFSTPRIGKLRLGDDDDSATDRWAVFFAGGYDENKDEYEIGDDDRTGRAIYVVDALTGVLLWKAAGTDDSSYGDDGTGRRFRHPDLKDSIPSDLTIADTDGDGAIDRLVVGDTGGNVWRADVGSFATANWELTLLAKLGRHGVASPGRPDDRRFFHEPDLVLTTDGRQAFDAVLLGSGDRENPLDKPLCTPVPPAISCPTIVTENQFFMIRDNATDVGEAEDSRADPAIRDLTADGLTDLTNVNCAVATPPGTCNSSAITTGWRIDLTGDREKVLASALTFSNTVFFTSYLPTDLTENLSCAPSEGTGKLYAVNLLNASPVFEDYDRDQSSLALSDRGTSLGSKGIPAQVVYVPGYGDKSILSGDLKFRESPGSNRFRTHWQRLNN